MCVFMFAEKTHKKLKQIRGGTFVHLGDFGFHFNNKHQTESFSLHLFHDH